MDGEDSKRLCQDCQCSVYNIAEMTASEAEELLAKSDDVCTVVTTCQTRGILTRDGWIPRILAAGAVAATMSGCFLVEARFAGKRKSTKGSLMRQAEIMHEIYAYDCLPKTKDTDEKGCQELLDQEKKLRTEASKTPD